MAVDVELYLNLLVENLGVGEGRIKLDDHISVDGEGVALVLLGVQHHIGG
jgi:hypothetical protein